MENTGGATSVSFAKKTYLILRFPVVLGFLGFSGVFFAIGLLNSLGYQGTTNIRYSKDNPEWKNFIESNGGERGRPFMWKGDLKPATDSVGRINFDTRLVKALNYLKNSKTGENCGWKQGHELLKLDINSTKFSDLSTPPWEVVPLSTIYRGVGVRIAEADYIKCTIEPVADPKDCPEAPEPLAFGEKPILLTDPNYTPLSPEPHGPGCKVTCAVDYYPNKPTGLADESEKIPPAYSTSLTSLVKPLDPFPIEEIADKGAKAGVFKATQLSVELMNIDEPGCEKPSGNTGFSRLIPLTLIEPNWVVKELGNNWETMKTTAETKFPFSFQQGSSLAGLCPDELLNLKGLHLNY